MDGVEFGGMVGFTGGDRRLADLYASNVVETRRLAYLLTGSRETADDLTQDAFIKSFGKLAHLRREENFRPYLRRTVVNLAKMQYRRKAVEQRHLDSQKADSPQLSTLPDEDEVLRDALIQLPYRQRAAIVLRHYLDMADEDVAEILGCAAGTVRSLVSRGLVSLRETLGDVVDG